MNGGPTTVMRTIPPLLAHRRGNREPDAVIALRNCRNCGKTAMIAARPTPFRLKSPATVRTIPF
jgi:hypothetical protein